jgi:DNA-binding CsgD family transcriptional regulator
VLVDEGAPKATLLRRANARGIAADYCTRLLNALGDGAARSGPPEFAQPRLPLPVPAERGVSGPLVERLSARERDVVQLVVLGASNQEIAKRLFVTTGTVKKHMHHILGKFDVRSRAQLIVRLIGFHAHET